jgi:cytochrome c oxidase assembly protein subunit 15
VPSLADLSVPRATLRRFALASVAANAGIVVTGGVVRLTGSGLGCPTWPRCTADTYVTTPAMGAHGVIEFGNRTLTGVVGILAVVCLVLALLRRRRHTGWSEVRYAALVLAGIPAQAVIGGITVLTDLNPWVVGLHFLASMAVIAAAYALWSVTRAPAGPRWETPPAVRRLGGVLVAVTAAVLVVGTIVTGSGPHAGDEKARRTGLDPELISQLHVDLVMLLIGLSVATVFAIRAVGGPVRAAVVLVAVELSQGLIGFVQYATGLPAVLVAFHMAGSCAVWLAALAVADGLRRPAVAPTFPVAAVSPTPAVSPAPAVSPTGAVSPAPAVSLTSP